MYNINNNLLMQIIFLDDIYYCSIHKIYEYLLFMTKSLNKRIDYTFLNTLHQLY